jgi:nucleolar GTP-binding protein
MDGKNIADFVDPDILTRLEELEAEEKLLEDNKANEMEESVDELSEDMIEAYAEV